jgi:hypothetical protein
MTSEGNSLTQHSELAASSESDSDTNNISLMPMVKKQTEGVEQSATKQTEGVEQSATKPTMPCQTSGGCSVASQV